MWPLSPPIIVIVISVTWGREPGHGRVTSPARPSTQFPGLQQVQSHPASVAASRGGGIAKPVDPIASCLEL